MPQLQTKPSERIAKKKTTTVAASTRKPSATETKRRRTKAEEKALDFLVDYDLWLPRVKSVSALLEIAEQYVALMPQGVDFQYALAKFKDAAFESTSLKPDPYYHALFRQIFHDAAAEWIKRNKEDAPVMVVKTAGPRSVEVPELE